VTEGQHGDGAQFFQPVSAAKQADAQHAVFEAGHQEGEVLASDVQQAFKEMPQPEQQDADSEDERKNDQVTGLEFELQKGDEEYRRQGQVDDQFAQVVDGAFGQEFAPAHPETEQDEQDDGQDAVENLGGLFHVCSEGEEGGGYCISPGK